MSTPVTATITVSMIIACYNDLLHYWGKMLTAYADNEQDTTRAQSYRDCAGKTLACKSFHDLVKLLQGAPAESSLSFHIEQLEACCLLRRWANGKCSAVLQDWYAQYADNTEVTRRIATMVDEVCAAYSRWINGDGSPKYDPNTGTWHDNQCRIWGLLIAGETPNRNPNSLLSELQKV